jgi:23S rRNA (uracil1939-C5)-methyltransferase
MRIRIDSMIYGGDGSGRDLHGNVVSVPFTLPEETVEASLSVTTSAELLSIETASSDRVTPGCQHFGTCGGCQYQHANYDAQTRFKLDILRDTLAAAGLTGLPETQLHTAEPWGYRNRIRLRAGSVEGELRIGYNRRGTYAMLPIRECPIAAPLLMRAAEAVRALASTLPTWTRELAEIELFTDAPENRLQITFFLRAERSIELAKFCESLRATLPELAGAGIVVVGPSGRKDQPGSQWGAPGLNYRAGQIDYWVSRGGFFQVNRFLVDKLVELVITGRTGTLAWDLYAGVGLFSRALAPRYKEIVAVETVATDLTAALKGNGQRVVAATTLDFLRNAVLQRERPDLIVADPPRAGLGPEVTDLLCRIKAPQLVYVSCDPVTLARDLKTMVDSGYTVHAIHLVDLFPQTFHMETVVMLNR